jgi:NADPH:quinone reductase
MVKSVRFEAHGGPEVLRLVDCAYREPGPREAWVEQEAIGVNYLDVMQRGGAVSVPLPSGLGLEAAGRVTAVGAEVEDLSVGDRVAYVMGPLGSYATGRLYPAERLVRLPETMSASDAAATLFKGLTAQYLIKSTYPIAKGDVVLLYGAAGGVGQVLAAWAGHLGATVIGVVSRSASVDRAEAAGCAHVLLWSAGDLPAEVMRLTNGRGVDVVYDGVGRRTFDASLESLKTRGMMVSMGASSGVPEPVSIPTLNRKSLFLTRPSLAAHVTEIGEYRARVDDLFAAVAQGIVKPAISATYGLADVAEAHAALEHGRAAGTILLIP